MDSDEAKPGARVLLRPSWLVLHLLVVVIGYVMYRLGVWQWHRGGEATGGLRNYSYGIEWWAFCVLTALGWCKYCYDEVLHVSGEKVERVRVSPVPQQIVAPPVTEAEDPELAAWNARFAELARRDQEADR